ncbi:MAG: PEP/pyruvate-binding domain-containing protein [Vicinamibacterales bacterium]
MDPFVVPLDSPDATASLAGEKAASLSRLLRGGVTVPPGFVVTTAAYRACLGANALDGRILELVQTADADNPSSLERASGAIRPLVDAGIVPPEVLRQILDEYRRLVGHRTFLEMRQPAGLAAGVAIRSSGTAEDLAVASFAGQQDTFLNVTEERAVVQAIRRCWSSLWTPRAIAYRARRGIDATDIALGVIVQSMVPADAAGVLSTINPVSGAADETVINAAWGLGESVASGRVTPDTIVVNTRLDRVARVHIGDKATMTVLAADGVSVVDVEEDRRRQPVLDTGRALELVRLGRRVHEMCGAPQEIEWALAGTHLFVLQSRPVTGLPPARQPACDEPPAAGPPHDDTWPAYAESPPHAFDLWTQANVGEAWPDPVTPLVWSGAPLLMRTAMRHTLGRVGSTRARDIQWVQRFRGRVYYNEGALTHVLSHELGLPATLLDAAHGNRRAAARRGDAERLRPLRVVRALPSLAGLALRQVWTVRQGDRYLDAVGRVVPELIRRDLRALADRELWTEFQSWMDRFARVMAFHVGNSAMVDFAVLELLLSRWLGRRDLACDLVAGLDGVRPAEIGAGLWDLAKTIESLGLREVVVESTPQAALATLRQMPRARPFTDAFDAFLVRHGHRCASEGELLHPRWAEAPEPLMAAMAGYLRGDDTALVDPVERAAAQRRRRESAVASATAHLTPIRRVIFRQVLRRVQNRVRARENSRDAYVRVASVVRRLALAFGERWTARGRLDRADDIFFISIPEIEADVTSAGSRPLPSDLRALVRRRRENFHYWFTTRAPDVLDTTGAEVVEADVPLADPSVVIGIPASAGKARGPARIIVDSREAGRLRPGDILVTRATDPGWTPVFPLARALVLEVGGQLSHAAIVARELGLPAVVNVPNAVTRIRDGQIITVDGTSGEIHLHS